MLCENRRTDFTRRCDDDPVARVGMDCGQCCGSERDGIGDIYDANHVRTHEVNVPKIFGSSMSGLETTVIRQ